MDFSIFDSFVARDRRDSPRPTNGSEPSEAGRPPFASMLERRDTSNDTAPASHAPPAPSTTNHATDTQENRPSARPRTEEGDDAGKTPEAEAVHEDAETNSSDTSETPARADVPIQESSQPPANGVIGESTDTARRKTMHVVAKASENQPGTPTGDASAGDGLSEHATQSGSPQSATHELEIPSQPAAAPDEATDPRAAPSHKAAGAAASAEAANTSEMARSTVTPETDVQQAATQENAPGTVEGHKQAKRSRGTDREHNDNPQPPGTRIAGNTSPAETNTRPPTPAGTTAGLDGLSDTGNATTAPQSSQETAAPQRSAELSRPFGFATQGDMQPSARGAAGTDGSAELSPTDQTRLLDRVARAIQVAPQRGGVIRLRLRPPELGSLQLEVSVERGAVSARLEAETHMARNVLLDNLPQLRDRLAEQGVRIEQFDVQVSARDNGQSEQQSDHPQHFQQLPDTGRPPARQEPTIADQGVPAVTAVVGPGNLNVVI